MRSIFLLQGLFVGVTGTVIGLTLGVLMATQVNEIVDALEWITGRHLLDGSYFVEVPSRVEITDLLVTGIIAGILAVWAAWLPAQRAIQVDPVSNLHTSRRCKPACSLRPFSIRALAFLPLAHDVGAPQQSRDHKTGHCTDPRAH